MKRHEAIDWTAQTTEQQSVRVCMDCKAEKPSGKWCTTCDRETDSERVYVDVPRETV